MKVVNVNGERYEIRSKDDMISLAHQLVKSGYSIAQIAEILGVTERTVKRYLSDCW